MAPPTGSEPSLGRAHPVDEGVDSTKAATTTRGIASVFEVTTALVPMSGYESVEAQNLGAHLGRRHFVRTPLPFTAESSALSQGTTIQRRVRGETAFHSK